MTDVFFGDSQTVSNALIGQNAAALYPWLFTAIAGSAPPLVRAIGGSCAADQATQIYPYVGVSDDRFFLMIGTNDHAHYPADTNGLGLFGAVLHAEAYHLCGNILPASGAAWTRTGTWDTAWSPLGTPTLKTHANGSTAAVQFTGDAFDLAYLSVDTNQSSFSLAVDGTSLGAAIPIQYPQAVTTYNLGQIFAPILLRRTGFGAGAHTLTITANVVNLGQGGHPVCIDYIGAGSNSRKLYLLSAPRTNLGATDDAKVAAFNARMAAVASEAAAKGLAVSFIDACAGIEPARDMCTDGWHLNNQGHWVVAGAMRRGLVVS